MDHVELGRHGEVLAAAYLLRQGYDIRARNYRWSRAEIDVIAFRQNRLHFIEVKTRAWRDPELARAAVTQRKQRLVMATAGRYMEDVGWDGDFQFDIIAVIIDGRGGQEIHFWPDAYGFDEI